MKPLAFKPQTLRPVHAISDGWVGTNQRLWGLADGAFRDATAPVADIDPTLCSARCGILHDELRL